MFKINVAKNETYSDITILQAYATFKEHKDKTIKGQSSDFYRKSFEYLKHIIDIKINSLDYSAYIVFYNYIDKLEYLLIIKIESCIL